MSVHLFASMLKNPVAGGGSGVIGETSLTHYLVTSNTGAVRAVRKSDGFVEAATFPQITSASYGVCFFNNRWFIPVYADGVIYVYNESFVFQTSISTFGVLGVNQPLRVFSNGTKLVCVGTNEARFFTFNNSTNTATATANPVISWSNTATDIQTQGNRIFIGCTYTGLSNIIILNWATEAFQLAFNAPGILANQQITELIPGTTKILACAGPNALLLDFVGYNDVSGALSIGRSSPSSLRSVYAQGKFFLNADAQGVVVVNESTNAVNNLPALSPALQTAGGMVTDSDNVYLANVNTGASALVYAINATTLVQVGTAVNVPINFPRFNKS